MPLATAPLSIPAPRRNRDAVQEAAALRRAALAEVPQMLSLDGWPRRRLTERSVASESAHDVQQRAYRIAALREYHVPGADANV